MYDGKGDSYFDPALSEDMYQAFISAGGQAEYHLLPAFGRDGHWLLESHSATKF